MVAQKLIQAFEFNTNRTKVRFGNYVSGVQLPAGAWVTGFTVFTQVTFTSAFAPMLSFGTILTPGLFTGPDPMGLYVSGAAGISWIPVKPPKVMDDSLNVIFNISGNVILTGALKCFIEYIYPE